MQCHAKPYPAKHPSPHTIKNPKAPTSERIQLSLFPTARAAIPLALVSAASPFRPVAPALAVPVPVTPGWLRVVVAGNNAVVVVRPELPYSSCVVVVRPELPYSSCVAPGARLMVVPSTVMVPPGVSVCPPIRNVVPVPGAAVKVCEPMVRRGGFVMGGWFEGVRVVVWPFTIRAVAPGARDIVVPAAVMTPPGVRVSDPMRYVVPDPGCAVKTPLPIVSGGGVTWAAATFGTWRVDVAPLITTNEPDGPRDTVVPSTVIA
ncbi:hypothetical protein BS50DRAFT_239914 [Corynespora cassiicola Philippines]|uniref:Uncharacterized protein n=1 Tax=Corynespora cassiicola Philippines TaxID=1448308 RepID=A0A2T2P2T7_CORCC|nr:hypothetical protein BS50DRAFT_239914 [Corynespora cassiicola Philippines]